MALDLNPVGVTVWKLLDGQHSLDEIVAQVRQCFDNVSGTVSEDIVAFVENLAKQGFVEYKAEATRS